MRATALLPLPLLVACGASPTTATGGDCDGPPTVWDTPLIQDEVRFTCTTQYKRRPHRGGHPDPRALRAPRAGRQQPHLREERRHLLAVGTEACPVTITSANTSPAAGDWRIDRTSRTPPMAPPASSTRSSSTVAGMPAA